MGKKTFNDVSISSRVSISYRCDMYGNIACFKSSAIDHLTN